MKQEFVTKSFEETQKIGIDIVKNLKGGNVLALYGNLGAGKTTFVQGLAKGLGIKQKIISPTFIIVRKYNIPRHSGKLSASRISDRKSERHYISQDDRLTWNNFYHIDLYRIENENDVKGLGLEEIINDPLNIVAIEWPEKIDNLLPKNAINLHFEYIENDKREITIQDL